jgi:hypothetical protein
MEIAASPRITHKSVPSQACTGNLADLLFIIGWPPAGEDDL